MNADVTSVALSIPTHLLEHVFTALEVAVAADGYRTVLVAAGGPVQLRIIPNEPLEKAS
jgi:hypothetical protein